MTRQQKELLAKYLSDNTVADTIKGIKYDPAESSTDVVIYTQHGPDSYIDRITTEGEVIYDD